MRKSLLALAFILALPGLAAAQQSSASGSGPFATWNVGVPFTYWTSGLAQTVRPFAVVDASTSQTNSETFQCYSNQPWTGGTTGTTSDCETAFMQVPPGRLTWERALTAYLVNNSTSGDGSQNTAFYSRAVQASSGSTWGATHELDSNFPNPVGSSTGDEEDVYGIGGDASLARVVLDVWAKTGGLPGVINGTITGTGPFTLTVNSQTSGVTQLGQTVTGGTLGASCVITAGSNPTWTVAGAGCSAQSAEAMTLTPYDTVAMGARINSDANTQVPDMLLFNAGARGCTNFLRDEATAKFQVTCGGLAVVQTLVVSGNDSGVYPSNGNSGVETWNFQGGAGEIDYWNTYTSATSSHAWYQQTGGSSATLLASLSPAGLFKATAGFAAGGSAPGLTGSCTTSTQVGGATAGTFKATCTAQTVIVALPTAPNGWVCTATDETTVADTLKQTATATNSCTFTGTTVAADVIGFTATAY
jgi:hypothetical protein